MMHQAWRSAMSLFFVAATAAGATVIATGASAAASTHSHGAARASAFGQWGTAQEMPGTAALNLGGDAGGIHMACASRDNCSASGFYTDGSGHLQVFVISKSHGTWGPAIEVPGLAALNVDGDALVDSVSCGAPGDCSVVGSYKDGSGHRQSFVVSEVNGSWGTAIEAPGLAALNLGGVSTYTSVSCTAPGYCSAGGVYTDGSGHVQMFVESQVNGSWGAAIEAPGSAALNQGGNAALTFVSCSAPGVCAAGGDYTDGSGHPQAFVESQVNGSWGPVTEVPGTAALNTGGSAVVSSLSCTAPGDCSAGGAYTDSASHQQSYVDSEVNGSWGTATEVAGLGALNVDGEAIIRPVSCSSPGNCTAAGYYKDGAGHYQAFVVNQTFGYWGSAQQLPSLAALNQGGDAAIVTVSCTAWGTCTAGGLYSDSAGHQQAFVVSEAFGSWGTATEIPGTAALNQGTVAQTEAVACSGGNCSAAGFYTASTRNWQAFVADSTSCWRPKRGVRAH